MEKAEWTIILLYVPYLCKVVKACVRTFLTNQVAGSNPVSPAHLSLKMDMLAGISVVENGYNIKESCWTVPEAII